MIELNFRKAGPYLVFNTGQVYSIKSGRFLKGTLHHSRTSTYLRLKLRHKGRTIRVFTHQLVAACFCVPKGQSLGQILSQGLQVNHLDGNTHNNSADNLEWVSQQDNILHAELLHGLTKGVA